MVTWDDLDSEKSNNSDDEQANICLMANTDDEQHALNLTLIVVLHQTMKKICLLVDEYD